MISRILKLSNPIQLEGETSMELQKDKMTNSYLNDLCKVLLEILPFEGSLIALSDRKLRRWEATGAAGIFSPKKVQAFLSSNDLQHSDYFIPQATSTLQNFTEYPHVDGSIREQMLPFGERALVVDNVQRAVREGVNFSYELYEEGSQPRIVVALRLFGKDRNGQDRTGVLLFNNINSTLQQNGRLITSTLLACAPVARSVSSLLSETGSNQSATQVPNKDQLFSRIVVDPQNNPHASNQGESDPTMSILTNIEFTPKEIRRLVSWPILILSCLAFLSGLLLFKGTVLGLGMTLGGGLLGYESLLVLGKSKRFKAES